MRLLDNLTRYNYYMNKLGGGYTDEKDKESFWTT